QFVGIASNIGISEIVERVPGVSRIEAHVPMVVSFDRVPEIRKAAPPLVVSDTSPHEGNGMRFGERRHEGEILVARTKICAVTTVFRRHGLDGRNRRSPGRKTVVTAHILVRAKRISPS